MMIWQLSQKGQHAVPLAASDYTIVVHTVLPNVFVALERSFDTDLHWLETNKLIDYSLLVGVGEAFVPYLCATWVRAT